jgi:hypothetical protein
MNHPAPVPTLLQRQALATYLDTQRDAIYHAERRTHRVVVLAPSPVVPEPPEPRQFCAVPEADKAPLFTVGEAVIIALMLGAGAGIYYASLMGWLP